MSDILSYAAWQRFRCAVRHAYRRYRYLAGWRPPDARDQELRDRGAEIEFATRLVRNRRERARRARLEADRIAGRRETWWLQQQEASR